MKGKHYYKTYTISIEYSTTARDRACQIKNLYESSPKGIILNTEHPSKVPDNAYAYNNIRDACNGIKAERSRYGNIVLCFINTNYIDLLLTS